MGALPAVWLLREMGSTDSVSPAGQMAPSNLVLSGGFLHLVALSAIHHMFQSLAALIPRDVSRDHFAGGICAGR